MYTGTTDQAQTSVVAFATLRGPDDVVGSWVRMSAPVRPVDDRRTPPLELLSNDGG